MQMHIMHMFIYSQTGKKIKSVVYSNTVLFKIAFC